MRTRTALVITSLIALTLPGTPAAQAARAAGPEAWVAYDADPGSYVEVRTRGFGHGIGMSQYGAKGRADAGQKAAQILDFYYPGTTQGTAAGLIRAWVTADSDANTIVRPTKGLRVLDLGNGRTHVLPEKKGAAAWRLTVVAGKTRVAWLKAGTWRAYRPSGKVLTGDGEFRAPSRVLTLVYGGKNHPYRGAMRLVAGRTINVVSLDNYLRGVIAAEMPAMWATEALKTQAVAARTYAAFERAAAGSRSFHVYDTTQSQVYRGIAAEHPNTNAVVGATAKQVRLFGGKPAFTQFSASNGGTTAKPGTPTPYLVGGRSDTFDTYPVSNPQLGPKSKASLEAKYPALGNLQRFRVLDRDTDGRVLKVELDGSSSGTVVIKGTDLRSLMGLRSTYFTFVG